MNMKNNYKVDVTIQSYKKPELLIYTLLSLHKHSKDTIDTVWINDDKSGNNVLKIYKSSVVIDALYPWKIKVRENSRRMGWWLSFVKGVKPKYLTWSYKMFRMLWNIYNTGHAYVKREDIRYQWAIDNTDKDYLYVLHDDVTFYDDIISLYLKNIQGLANPVAVGDLGQCWRCAFQKDGCSPSKILNGDFPSKNWPNTKKNTQDHEWACRINEWSALISVKAAKTIETEHQLFFGNFDNKGDIAAYWFAVAVMNGFQFADPLPTSSERSKYYLHGYDGKAGHSVWTDQGNGKIVYQADEIKKRLLSDFSFDWLSIVKNII